MPKKSKACNLNALQTSPSLGFNLDSIRAKTLSSSSSDSRRRSIQGVSYILTRFNWSDPNKALGGQASLNLWSHSVVTIEEKKISGFIASDQQPAAL